MGGKTRRTLRMLAGAGAAVVLGAGAAGAAPAAEAAAEEAAEEMAANAGEAAGADGARAAIEAANEELSAALAADDAQAIAELYTEDAWLMPPGTEILKGREAIRGFWRQAIEGGLEELSLETLSVERAGNLAAETGRARMVQSGGGGRSHYVVVWKQVDGAWKLHRDIWNMHE